jgi:hypothetical protein
VPHSFLTPMQYQVTLVETSSRCIETIIGLKHWLGIKVK